MTEQEKLGLPWIRADYCGALQLAKAGGDPFHDLVIQGCDEYGDGIQSEDMAEFIHRACNAHHQALEALHAMCQWLHDEDEACYSELACDNCSLSETCVEGKIKAAIKALEG